MRRPFPHSSEDTEEAVYQIIDQEGHVFGPIDRSTLKTWADENRITTGMMVLDEAGSRIEPATVLRTGAVTGIDVEMPGYQPSVSQHPTQVKKARPAQRFAAFFIDFAMGFVLYNSVEFVGGLLTLRAPGADAWPIWGYLRYLYPIMLAAFLVTRDLWTERGSLGKHLMGLQVTRHGRIADRSAMIRRNAIFALVALLPFRYGAWLAVPLLITVGVVELVAIWSGKRIGDRLAGTRVVRR